MIQWYLAPTFRVMWLEFILRVWRENATLALPCGHTSVTNWQDYYDIAYRARSLTMRMAAWLGCACWLAGMNYTGWVSVLSDRDQHADSGHADMTFLHDAVCLPLSCADYTNKFNTLANTTRPSDRRRQHCFAVKQSSGDWRNAGIASERGSRSGLWHSMVVRPVLRNQMTPLIFDPG